MVPGRNLRAFGLDCSESRQFSACALGSGLRGLTVVLLGRAGFELGGSGALRVRIVWLSVFWSRDLRGKGETASGSLKNPP